MYNALTIDVEDYFMVTAFSDVVKSEDWSKYESRVENNTLQILDILDEFRVKATFFTLGWVAEYYPKLIREIHHRGHEVASHGYNHRLTYDLSLQEFREDVRRSKALLEDITGESIVGYRATSYSIMKKSLWALDILIEEGFTYDSSIFPIHHDIYGYPEFSRFPVNIHREGVGDILEIPISTISIFGKNIPFAGGGYLRLFPIRLTEWGIHRLNEKEGKPVIVYIHPWELDPKQPRLNGRRLSIFRHYINMETTSSKLRGLLSKFKFGPINQVFHPCTKTQ